MSTDLVRHALNGATMGTRWSALVFTRPDFAPAPLQAALQLAVDEVDTQMSTWKPDSALMQFNAAPLNVWIDVPSRLLEVLQVGAQIGRASGGAFDMGLGDAVTAWGFGPNPASPDLIRAALTGSRAPAHEALQMDLPGGRLRKTAPVTLDLNGIAKGYGVDRLAQTLTSFGITAGLVGIDGEMRALGLRPDGTPWTLAIEAPHRTHRAPHAILALQDAAVATSGDYRHWVEVGGRPLSHTMDPLRGAPLNAPPASVTVIAATCAAADAWATALMVRGATDGAKMASNHGLDALFLIREGATLREVRVGRLFNAPA